MTRVRKALVIGGGIAGPAAAMALQKAGIEPVLYEAHPQSADGAGVFLTLASNGVDALQTIGADRTALAAGFPTPVIALRSTTGKSLGETRTGLTPPDGTTSRTVKRADLYRALHEETASRGIRMEHGKRLVAVEETGDGVRAMFSDGTEAIGEVLIGADGVHSTVRTLIDPAAPAPVYSGLISLGGYTGDAAVDDAPGSYTMIFGKRAFFGFAIAPGGEVWWFANVPRSREPARGEVEAISGQEWQRRLVELFTEDAGPAVRLIQASAHQDIMKATAVHSVPHLPTWHTDRIVVIGDAAHAPTPTSGQGASLSIEDAVVVAKCLRDLPGPQALARFEALRRPRAERIVKQAARINSGKVAGPVGRLFRDAMLPLILKMVADSKQARQVYDHHIDWDDATRS
ncbi:2-polyprenyl-6-methoxyphenol hydroxylase-like FAD-dependent oxidoreductase [Streptosporangium album]|uniref:2-polyprenyl-6-methoxyphenol hydroxylase-like FAD-dependent oxidoreductase n=1 Tax=Streptosporangium album TaxID=47479 RepID=A0A7W7W7I6_9ACTN|nr:NAD(P)/FAD-dependent oxidoreductase [Streptosporangium album]MBB4936781.1 2-polyprenyl-6-methoxyphenol hydroxylase-like FAD-dependent oxidoreductase [Streptosporangium album]